MICYTFPHRLNEAYVHYHKHTKRNIAQLCKAVGISASTFHRFTRGEKLPTIDIVFRLADELCCPPQWLFGTMVNSEEEPFCIAPWERV